MPDTFSGPNAFKVEANPGVINYNAAPITPTLRATPPAPPAHFTGREADLAKFAQLLTSGASVAITALHGMGGIGKTSLAQKLAERVRNDFPGGVLWWTLGPNPDVITALDVWARQADPRADLTALPTAQARAEVVRSMLAQLGKLCVIIDDVWDAEAFHVLQSAVPPGSPILITTRDSDLAKSLRCRVERIDALSDDEAVALLVNLLGPLNGHEDAACDIAHLTEGLPLALELIAGLADSPADLPALAQKLRTKPMLDVLKRGTTREQSIEACFTMSYEHVDADLQRRFRALGVFALAPFDRNAIAAVWDDEDTDAVDDAIRLLVRRSLLTRVIPNREAMRNPGETDETPRQTTARGDTEVEYKQHALLHDYALKLLHATPSPIRGSNEVLENATDEQRIGEGWGEASRHAAYYRRFAEEQNWRTVEHFFDQIDWGWQWVQANAPEQIIDYVVTACGFLKNRGRQTMQLNLLKAGLLQARNDNDRINEGNLLSDIGRVYNNLGHQSQALDCFQSSLAIYRELGNREFEGIILNNIGVVYRTLGQKDKALDFLHQALALHREVGDQSSEGAALSNIGQIYKAHGQMAEALNFMQQSLHLRREARDRSGEGAALNNIGSVYDDLGQKDKALNFYQQALTISSEVGDLFGEGTTLSNIGGVYGALGQKGKALDFYQRALAIHRKVGNRLMEGTTLSHIGGVYDDLGQQDKALDFYQQAHTIHREVGDRSGEGATLNNIGSVYWSTGQNEEAFKTYQEVLVIQREVGNRFGEASTLNNIGTIHSNLGRNGKALDTYQQALAIGREVGDRSGEGTTLSNIGSVYYALGELEKTIEYFEQAIVIFREVGDRWRESALLSNIGLLLDTQGRTIEAVLYLKQCVTLMETLGHPDLEANRAALERVRGKLGNG